jgi:hypothetical protein
MSIASIAFLTLAVVVSLVAVSGIFVGSSRAKKGLDRAGEHSWWINKLAWVEQHVLKRIRARYRKAEQVIFKPFWGLESD